MAVNRPLAVLVLSLCSAVLFAVPLELKVVGDRVNLRSRPQADSEVVGQVSTGETLLAPDGIPNDAEWVKVRPPTSVDLWIFSALVKDGAVSANDTYVRCGPGSHFKPVGKLRKGDKVETRGSSGDWLRIGPVDAAELYISAAYVLAVPAKEEPVAVDSVEVPVEAEPTVAETVAADNTAEAPAEAEPAVVDRTEVPAEMKTAVAASAEAPAEADPAVVEPVAAEPVETPAEPVVQPPSPPARLAAYSFAVSQQQGVPVKLCGRVERIAATQAPGFTRYQLVEKAGYSKAAVMCRLVGLDGQWFELIDSEVEVSGNLWIIVGDSIPVLDVSRAIRVASWEK